MILDWEPREKREEAERENSKEERMGLCTGGGVYDIIYQF